MRNQGQRSISIREHVWQRWKAMKGITPLDKDASNEGIVAWVFLAFVPQRTKTMWHTPSGQMGIHMLAVKPASRRCMCPLPVASGSLNQEYTGHVKKIHTSTALVCNYMECCMACAARIYVSTCYNKLSTVLPDVLDSVCPTLLWLKQFCIPGKFEWDFELIKRGKCWPWDHNFLICVWTILPEALWEMICHIN